MPCKIFISNIDEQHKYSANLDELLKYIGVIREKKEYWTSLVDKWKYLADLIEKHNYSVKLCIQRLDEKDLWVLATWKWNNKWVWIPTAKWKTI